MAEFVLVVAGSRSFLGGSLWARAFQHLDDIRAKYPHMRVRSGMAIGADTMAALWARQRSVPLEEYAVTDADWKRDGKKAGMLRNIRMAAGATHLLAYWDGDSRGTKHMIDHCTQHGLVVHVKRYTPTDGLVEAT